jgi:hypothetical protein
LRLYGEKGAIVVRAGQLVYFFSKSVSFKMKMTKDSIGYSSNLFAGKKDQMVQVSKYVAEKGFVPKELVDNEVSWFYG